MVAFPVSDPMPATVEPCRGQGWMEDSTAGQATALPMLMFVREQAVGVKASLFRVGLKCVLKSQEA